MGTGPGGGEGRHHPWRHDAGVRGVPVRLRNPAFGERLAVVRGNHESFHELQVDDPYRGGALPV
ncbi:MAG: hypothetical protein R2716_08255 [Microthrixaceae bacterium]